MTSARGLTKNFILKKYPVNLWVELALRGLEKCEKTLLEG